MIRAAISGDRLAQRLRARAERLATIRAAALRRTRRNSVADWRSAAALWPDFIADSTGG